VIGRRIELAWPVRPEAPEWRGQRGESLAEGLRDLVPVETMPTEGDHRAIQAAVHRGEYVGVRMLSPHRGWVAVWHPVLVAALSQLELEVGTVRMLHHALHNLVLSGDMQPVATVRQAPGIGGAWHYLLKAPGLLKGSP
jgi:hypothetical protein